MKTLCTMLAVVLLCAPATLGVEVLLTPGAGGNMNHPLSMWDGGSGAGLLTDLGPLVDGDTSTVWQSDSYTHWQPTPMLTSPLPFKVTRVEVVAPTVRPERAAGEIQIMPVGTAGFTDALTVPALSAGEVWSAPMPAGAQGPLSAIRHNGGHWVEIAELRFYGEPVGAFTDVTKAGTLRTDPGSESPAGSLTDGLVTTTTDGYHKGGGQPHTIVTDFGPGQTEDIVYVAMNPNQYWKMPVRAVGTLGDYDLALVRASNFSGDVTNAWTGNLLANNGNAPAHAWVVTAVNGGSPLAMGSAGIGVNNFWGDLSEYVVLAAPEQPTTAVVPEPAALGLVGLGALGLLRRRRA